MMSKLLQDSARISDHGGTIGNIMDDDRAGTNGAPLSDLDVKVLFN